MQTDEECICTSSRGYIVSKGRMERVQISDFCHQMLICRITCELEELTPICDRPVVADSAPAIQSLVKTIPTISTSTSRTTTSITTTTSKISTTARITANTSPLATRYQVPTTQSTFNWLSWMNPFKPVPTISTTTARTLPTVCTCSSNGRVLRENESAIFEMSANCRQTRTCRSGCVLETSTPICNVQPINSYPIFNSVNNKCQCSWKGKQFSGLIPSDKVCYWLRCTSYLGFCQAQTVISCVHPDTKKIGPYWPDKNKPAPTEHPSWSTWEAAFVSGEKLRQRAEVGQVVQAVNPYERQREDCSVWRGCLPRPDCMRNYVQCIGTY